MIKYLTPAIFATELILSLDGFDGVLVVVEGQDDKMLYGFVLNSDRVNIIPSGNKTQAIIAINIINKDVNLPLRKKHAIVAFVDADFDRILGATHPLPVIPTDFHDLEIMLIWSHALDRFVQAHCQEEKIKNFHSCKGAESIREFLLQIGSFLGAMRLWSMRAGINLDLTELPYDRYLDRATLQCNRGRLCQAIFNRNRTKCHEISMAEIEERVTYILEGFTGDKRDLVQGHDSAALLGVLLRNALASKDAGQVTEEAVTSDLRLTYRPADWIETTMAEKFKQYLGLSNRKLEDYIGI